MTSPGNLRWIRERSNRVLFGNVWLEPSQERAKIKQEQCTIYNKMFLEYGQVSLSRSIKRNQGYINVNISQARWLQFPELHNSMKCWHEIHTRQRKILSSIAWKLAISSRQDDWTVVFTFKTQQLWITVSEIQYWPLQLVYTCSVRQ